MDTESRLHKEQVFHDQRFSSGESNRSKAQKFYTVSKHAQDRYKEKISNVCKNKSLLDYGCGTGSSSISVAKMGAKVTGIDISSEGIKVAKERLKSEPYQIDFFVMNAEETDFSKDNFDVIIGAGILHHLNISKAYQEIMRIMKPNGHMIFLEPLGHNPFIKLYRLLTPKMRTEDERPLKEKDLKKLEKYFKDIEIEYFSLFTLLAVPFVNTRYFQTIYRNLINIDKKIFKFSFFRRNAWISVIHAKIPIK